MKKWIGSAVVVVVLCMIGMRVLNTWGYIGGALRPGGGGTATRQSPLDPAEVTVSRVSGRWLRKPNPKAEDEVLHLYPNGWFEWWTCVNGKVPSEQTPDTGTWEIRDGSIYVTQGVRTCWLGQVCTMAEPRDPPKYMALRISENGAVETYDRLETPPADRARPTAAVPHQMPAPGGQKLPPPIPPGLPVTQPKTLPTTGPKQLPTTGPK